MRTNRNLIQIWLLCASVLPAVNRGAQPVTQIAAGHYYSLFLKGDGTYNNTHRPEQIVSRSVP